MRLHTWHHVFPCPSVVCGGLGLVHQLWQACLCLWFYLFPKNARSWAWKPWWNSRLTFLLVLHVGTRGIHEWQSKRMKQEPPPLCLHSESGTWCLHAVTAASMTWLAVYWTAGGIKKQHSVEDTCLMQRRFQHLFNFYAHSCFLRGVAVTSLCWRSPRSYREQKPRSSTVQRRWRKLQDRQNVPEGLQIIPAVWLTLVVKISKLS